ncbi:MAG: FkbM family methyltransferase [Pseudomonadota bacterium]
MNSPIQSPLSDSPQRLSRDMFRSHAQSLEDASLFKALHDVRAGTYLDIGAYHPLRDSVSAGFFERSWRGISVDPLPGLDAVYARERPDDIFISAAVSTQAGTAVLSRVEGTGLSAIDGDGEDRITVRTIRLADLFDQMDGPVHWMKVDVEGHESAVLDSWDDHSKRPWVLCLECDGEAEPDWHGALVARDYDYVRYDGLNRFYLHRDQASRRDGLAIPPGVRDRILVTEWSGLSEIPNRLISLRAERDSMGALMKRQDQALDDYRFALKAANRAQEELHQSIKDHRYAIDKGNEAQTHLHNHVARLEAELEQTRSELKAALRTPSLDLQAKIAHLTRRLASEKQSHLAAADALRTGTAETERALQRAHQSQRDLQDERAHHQARIGDLESQLQALRIRESHLVEEIDRHGQGLDAIRRSTSWRLTAPVRALTSGLRRSHARTRALSGRIRSFGYGAALRLWALDIAVTHWRRDYKILRPLRHFILNRPSLGRRLAMRPDHWDESWNEIDPFDPDPSATQAKLARERAADPNPARYKGPPPSEHPDTLSPGRRPPPVLRVPGNDRAAMTRLLKQARTIRKQTP